jgi:hypothetical protein
VLLSPYMLVIRKAATIWLVLLVVLAPSNASADTFAMSVDSIDGYSGEKYNEEVARARRAELLGQHWIFEFFASGALLRVESEFFSNPGLIRLIPEGEERIVCKRQLDTFFEKTYLCPDALGMQQSFSFTTVGSYVRSAQFTQIMRFKSELLQRGGPLKRTLNFVRK